MRKTYGLTNAEMQQLSTYNGECNRGIVHTDDWKEKMAVLQDRYITAFYESLGI